MFQSATAFLSRHSQKSTRQSRPSPAFTVFTRQTRLEREPLEPNVDNQPCSQWFECLLYSIKPMKQLPLRGFAKRGGARPGAGRKKSPHSGPPHVRRGRLSPRIPVHVTARFARSLPSMRKELLARTVMAQIRRASARFWRIVQFSIQATHVHLLVEVESETELARGMKGLGVRTAKTVNRVLRRKGSVISGRYHVHPLRTPREVRNAIAYVLLNAHKHGELSSGWDPWSSSAWFDGWAKPLGDGAQHYRERVPIPVVPARTWLLAVGWKMQGKKTNASPLAGHE